MFMKLLTSLQEEETSFKKGVIYIGHIPHGFYEQELRGFFSQFGTVTRVKLARSREVVNMSMLI